MSKLYYPGADTVTQNFSAKYASDIMTTNCMVIHSTEGVNWPGYSGGATGPNATVFMSLKEKKMYVRQHFPANESSRALENRAGGVQTNTLNDFQIELIGTCDSTKRTSWNGLKAGVDYIYWPDAPDWALQELAKIVKWLNSGYPAFKIKNGAPRGWLQYPSSYGNKNGQRLSYTEWNALEGIVGHQHVPENVHGDPGDFKIAKLVAFALDVPVPQPAPPVVIPPVIINRMSPTNYFIGAKGDHITWLGERLIVHGFNKHFTSVKYEPGPAFTEIDRLNVQDFQKAQGWSGIGADGFPGSLTLRLLKEDPIVKPKTLNVSSISLNAAAYDSKRRTNYPRGRGLTTRLVRVKAVAALVSKKKPMWIHFQEISADMLLLMDAALPDYKRVGAGGRGRESYYRKDAGIKILGAQLQNVKHMLKFDTKEFLLTAWEKDGYRGLEVTFHNENEGTLFQKSQMKDVLTAAVKFGDSHKVPRSNILVTGDSNRKETSADVLTWGWSDAGSNAPVAINEKYNSTNGWIRASIGRRIDVDIVHRAIIRRYEQILTPIVSDHFPHYLIRSLIK